MKTSYRERYKLAYKECHDAIAAATQPGAAKLPKGGVRGLAKRVGEKYKVKFSKSTAQAAGASKSGVVNNVGAPCKLPRELQDDVALIIRTGHRTKR